MARSSSSPQGVEQETKPVGLLRAAGGAFADWQTPSLLPFAKGYAAPVNQRAGIVPDPKAFAGAYLGAFHEEFVRIQSDYWRWRGAFDGLFKHLPYDEAGSFACATRCWWTSRSRRSSLGPTPAWGCKAWGKAE